MACSTRRGRLILLSFPPGLAGPAAHETLLFYGVVGTEVDAYLVRLSPILSWTRGSRRASGGGPWALSHRSRADKAGVGPLQRLGVDPLRQLALRDALRVAETV